MSALLRRPPGPFRPGAVQHGPHQKSGTASKAAR